MHTGLEEAPDGFNKLAAFYAARAKGGVGLIVDIMTDNKNRISSDIRIATNKCGGTVATPGAVSYNFDRKGVLRISKQSMNEDDLLGVRNFGEKSLQELRERLLVRNFLPNPRTSTVGADMDGDHEMEE